MGAVGKKKEMNTTRGSLVGTLRRVKNLSAGQVKRISQSFHGSEPAAVGVVRQRSLQFAQLNHGYEA